MLMVNIVERKLKMNINKKKKSKFSSNYSEWIKKDDVPDIKLNGRDGKRNNWYFNENSFVVTEHIGENSPIQNVQMAAKSRPIRETIEEMFPNSIVVPLSLKS